MYLGALGKIKIGGNDIAYISNWSIEDTADVVEFSELGEAYKKKLVGQQSWSASADGAVDFTKDGQAALFSAKHAGTRVKCEFYLLKNKDAEKSALDVKFEGYGYIESLSVDLSAEDKGNISISIGGTGALKFPGAAFSIEDVESSGI